MSRHSNPFQPNLYSVGLEKYRGYASRITLLTSSVPPEKQSQFMLDAWSQSFPGLDPNYLIIPVEYTVRYVHTHLFKTLGPTDVVHPNWPNCSQIIRDIVYSGICIAFAQVNNRPLSMDIHQHCDTIHKILTTECSYDEDLFAFTKQVSESDPVQAGLFAQTLPQVLAAVRGNTPPLDARTVSVLYVRLLIHGYLGLLMANGRA